MMVTCGTSEFVTALISFAPSLMMPPCSYSVPTMNPVMFWKKISGVSARLASWMNCAPFSDSAENSTPLFARIPTG